MKTKDKGDVIATEQRRLAAFFLVFILGGDLGSNNNSALITLI